MTDFLLRERAPISDRAWAAIDEEARERLLPALAARKLVDFSGPHGWRFSATGLGRVRDLPGGFGEGVSALLAMEILEFRLRAHDRPGRFDQQFSRIRIDADVAAVEIRDHQHGVDLHIRQLSRTIGRATYVL